MKRAVVLSGGGAFGAFQTGVLVALAEKGIDFDVVAGVSVGTLNGAMLAQKELDKLVRLWEELKTSDIYSKYSLFSTVYRWVVEKKKGIYSSVPLYYKIKENISLSKVKVPFYYGLTSYYDEQYYSLTPNDFVPGDDNNYVNGVYASALMPTIWKSVPKVETVTYGTIIECLDGGVRNNTPLGDILRENPDEIYIIQCSSGHVEKKLPGNGKDIALKTISILLDEVTKNDTSEHLNINELVGQADAQGFKLINTKTNEPYKWYNTKVIKPKQSLGNHLDFSPASNKWRFELGYNQGKLYF